MSETTMVDPVNITDYTYEYVSTAATQSNCQCHIFNSCVVDAIFEVIGLLAVIALGAWVIIFLVVWVHKTRIAPYLVNRKRQKYVNALQDVNAEGKSEDLSGPIDIVPELSDDENL